MRKRSKLFVDGRLLVFPLAFGVGALFVRGWTSLIFLGVAALIYALERWQFANFPWFIDDIQAEMALSYELTDVGSGPPRAH